MATRLLEKQLEPVSTGREDMTRVKVGDLQVVVLSERFFDRIQPLVEYFVRREAPVAATEEWSDAKANRRAELIHKKYHARLTKVEKSELTQLDREAEAFVELQAPVRNEVLELMLAGLKQKARSKKSKS